MTNVQTLIDRVNDNATLSTETFTYSVNIECYFKDRTKKLFSFEKTIDYEMTLSHAEDYCAECTGHMISQIDRLQLMLTWNKMWLNRPGEEPHKLFEFLPTLYFNGYHTESCYI